LANLYFDHNISRHVRLFLWDSSHDLVFTRDIGRSGSTDDAQFLFSVQAGRIFITHDRHDFRLLHDAWLTWSVAFGMVLPPHPGILVLDQAPPETLARALSGFLGATTPGELPNAIFWWHRHDGWRQPITGGTWVPFQPDRQSEQE
jgi:hypothetical protein